MEDQQREFKLLGIFTGIFVAALIISQITSGAKIIAFGSLIIPGGTILFPITFIFNDILTETYGFVRARRVIWIGFFSSILAAITFWLIGILPGAEFWSNQEAYNTILGVVPRIVLASIVAYFFGELTNSVVISKMKYWARGAKGIPQAWRFIASTIAGEAVDSIVFMTIAFSGILTLGQMIQISIGLYLFKVIYEVIITPVSTRFSNWVKKIEGVDVIDTPESTSYNPFRVFIKSTTD